MGMVMVANKLPLGIHLDLPNGARVTIKGTALPAEKQREEPLPGGYILTPVDEAHWLAWRERNKNWDPVVRKLIFASPRADAARGIAKEQAELRTGLEPLDPEKPGPGIEPLKRDD